MWVAWDKTSFDKTGDKKAKAPMIAKDKNWHTGASFLTFDEANAVGLGV